MPLDNDAARDRVFLADMLADDYFPRHLVVQGQQILQSVCEAIERHRPADLAGLYAITHAATEAFNALSEDFEAADSEIETAAREAIASDFAFIARTYGYDADTEALIAPRDW